MVIHVTSKKVISVSNIDATQYKKVAKIKGIKAQKLGNGHVYQMGLKEQYIFEQDATPKITAEAGELLVYFEKTKTGVRIVAQSATNTKRLVKQGKTKDMNITLLINDITRAREFKNMTLKFVIPASTKLTPPPKEDPPKEEKTQSDALLYVEQSINVFLSPGETIKRSAENEWWINFTGGLTHKVTINPNKTVTLLIVAEDTGKSIQMDNIEDYLQRLQACDFRTKGSLTIEKEARAKHLISACDSTEVTHHLPDYVKKSLSRNPKFLTDLFMRNQSWLAMHTKTEDLPKKVTEPNGYIDQLSNSPIAQIEISERIFRTTTPFQVSKTFKVHANFGEQPSEAYRRTEVHGTGGIQGLNIVNNGIKPGHRNRFGGTCTYSSQLLTHEIMENYMSSSATFGCGMVIHFLLYGDPIYVTRGKVSERARRGYTKTDAEQTLVPFAFTVYARDQQSLDDMSRLIEVSNKVANGELKENNPALFPLIYFGKLDSTLHRTRTTQLILTVWQQQQGNIERFLTTLYQYKIDDAVIHKVLETLNELDLTEKERNIVNKKI